jgi:hypothetical protein
MSDKNKKPVSAPAVSELPPLPKPRFGFPAISEPGYSADQMRAYAQAALAIDRPEPAAQSADKDAIADIAAERARQKAVEGWTPEHDDEHDAGVLAAAASAYAVNAADQLHPYSQGDGGNKQPIMWPFDAEWWKPKNPRRDLVRAAALIVAEIDRIDRAALAKQAGKEPK